VYIIDVSGVFAMLRDTKNLMSDETTPEEKT
jgi:hypothetical protein